MAPLMDMGFSSDILEGLLTVLWLPLKFSRSVQHLVYHQAPRFWAAGRRPYIVFTFTGSVRNVRNDVNIYIYIYCIYMSTTWRTRSRYVIFWLYFGEIHSSAPAFISEESFRPEEFFKVLF